MKTNEKKRASNKGSQTFSKMIKGKWLIILVIVGVVYGLSQIVLDIDTDPMGVGGFSGITTEQEQEYYTLCAEGDFVGAKKVLNSFYNEYTQEFGKWRGGAWNDREARQKQQQYHTAMAYIFGQEATSIYYGEATDKTSKLISLLVAIPTEGAPLSEGKHGSGMFYDNDAGVGASLAIDHVVYQTWVRFYNDRCEQILNMALANDDIALATKVAKLFKTEVKTSFEQDEVRGDEYNIATVTYDDSRRVEATNRCSAAN